jgi:hypothetical protein
MYIHPEDFSVPWFGLSCFMNADWQKHKSNEEPFSRIGAMDHSPWLQKEPISRADGPDLAQFKKSTEPLLTFRIRGPTAKFDGSSSIQQANGVWSRTVPA